MKQKHPELIAPAGNWSSLKSAVIAGADAVYFGIKGINMRYGADNFDILEINKIMGYLHKKGKKGYLVLNVLIYDSEIDKVRNILDAAKEANVDAIVLWDMAVLSLAKERGLKMHLSTQASISNFNALKEYVSLGVERVVLARECTLQNIKDIAVKIQEENLNCGIEAFVHGAMCVSLSGRCFLSQHSFAKSANRGECIQPCRREFTITDSDKECQYVIGKDYLLSPKDLCTLKFLDKLISAGISAFKIEGRNRPPEYVKVVTSSYRHAIDAFFEHRLDENLKDELFEKVSGVFNRGFSNGFYLGVPDDLGGITDNDYEKIYIGEVLKYYKKIGVAEIRITNGMVKIGQDILISGKKTPAEFIKIEQMQIEHKSVDSVSRGMEVGIKIPFVVRPKDKVFLWKVK